MSEINFDIRLEAPRRRITPEHRAKLVENAAKARATRSAKAAVRRLALAKSIVARAG